MEFNGTIYEIIFRNEENGYTVAILDMDDMPVTVVGNMPAVEEGEHVSIEGDIIKHKTYGEQVKVNSYKIIPPQSEKGIVKYLSSGIIKGIGEKTAKRIVECFGKDTLDIMQYSPNRLKEVPGIGKKTLEKIINSFKDERELREIMIYLQNFDISPKLCIKIYKKYGSDTLKIINENPYRLADEVWGVGFLKADSVAKAMGISESSIYRIKSAVIFTLNQEAMNGHTYFPQEELEQKLSELLNLNTEAIRIGIDSMFSEGKIYVENYRGNRRVYSSMYHNSEAGAAKKLIRIAISEKEKIDVDIDDKISKAEKKLEMKFAEKQKEAIRDSVKEGVNVITGGPGTGKTTTINTIIDIYEEEGLEVLLAAPTGRAAKRMTEATGREAKTIHRLLEYSSIEDGGGMYFARSEDNPLEADLIIVDEMSMVDILLMNSLLSAVSSGTRLILVGDVDQLPSVGAGNVLRDIIESRTVNVVQLDEIFRQAQESMIVVNAHKINHGEFPVLNQKDKDFFFINEFDSDKIAEKILGLAKTRLPRFNQYDSFSDIQVLACGRRGAAGVNELNKILQKGLNPPRGKNYEKSVGDSVFRVGDKVMQIKNNYNTEWKIIEYGKTVEKGLGVYNGDMGYIKDIDKDEMELTVLFDDDREVNYPFGKLDELVLSYATTVHKSQGSEFPVVIMPITWWPPMLMTRNLLYTGITRAKEMVVLVGNPKYLRMMIENDNISERYSALDEKLSVINEFREEVKDDSEEI